jgi:hypothetical protein
MSTTYTLDPTTGTSPERRASSSLEPRTAASSQRDMRTFVTIFLVCAATATVVPALLSIHIENPSTKDGWCTFLANPQNSPVRPYVSPLFAEFHPYFEKRARHTYAQSILTVPTGTDWIATVNCDHGLNNTNFGSQIHY